MATLFLGGRPRSLAATAGQIPKLLRASVPRQWQHNLQTSPQVLPKVSDFAFAFEYRQSPLQIAKNYRSHQSPVSTASSSVAPIPYPVPAKPSAISRNNVFPSSSSPTAAAKARRSESRNSATISKCPSTSACSYKPTRPSPSWSANIKTNAF